MMLNNMVGEDIFDLIQPQQKSFEFLIVKYNFVVAAAQSLSNVQLFVTPWTVAHQDPLSMTFPRQQQWSGLPFPSTEDLPDPRTETSSPAWQVDSLPLNHLGNLSMMLPQLFSVDVPYQPEEVPSISLHIAFCFKIMNGVGFCQLLLLTEYASSAYTDMII